MNVSERELRIPAPAKLGEQGVVALLRELADAVEGDLKDSFCGHGASTSRRREDNPEQGEFSEVVRLHSGKRLDVNMTLKWDRRQPRSFVQSLDIVNPAAEATFKVTLLVCGAAGATIVVIIAFLNGWIGSFFVLVGGAGGFLLGLIPAFIMRGLLMNLMVPTNAEEWCKRTAAEIEESTEELCLEFIERTSAQILAGIEPGPGRPRLNRKAAPRSGEEAPQADEAGIADEPSLPPPVEPSATAELPPDAEPPAADGPVRTKGPSFRLNVTSVELLPGGEGLCVLRGRLKAGEPRPDDRLLAASVGGAEGATLVKVNSEPGGSAPRGAQISLLVRGLAPGSVNAGDVVLGEPRLLPASSFPQARMISGPKPALTVAVEILAVKCPRCEKSLKVKAGAVGKVVKCPACKQPFQVER